MNEFSNRHDRFTKPVAREQEALSANSTVIMDATSYYPPQVYTRLGELGSRWQFPSDHLPVAAQVDGIRIGSFNVLNAAYVHYFRDNKEGLASSALVSENLSVAPDTTWTKREQRCLQVVINLCQTLDVLALQECSPEFLVRLAKSVPASMLVHTARDDGQKNQIACVAKRDLLEGKITVAPYECRPNYSIMSFQIPIEGHPCLQFFHSHVPGSPEMPGLHEFGRYILRNADLSSLVVAVGDLNFPEATVETVFQGLGLPQFERLVKGNTSIGNLGDTPVAKDLDHILVFGERGRGSPLEDRALSPEIEHARRFIS